MIYFIQLLNFIYKNIYNFCMLCIINLKRKSIRFDIEYFIKLIYICFYYESAMKK